MVSSFVSSLPCVFFNFDLSIRSFCRSFFCERSFGAGQASRDFTPDQEAAKSTYYNYESLGKQLINSSTKGQEKTRVGAPVTRVGMSREGDTATV
jgi:hypothetical protein